MPQTPPSSSTAIFFAAFGADKSIERRRTDAVFDKVIVPAAARHGLDVVRVDRGSEPGNLISQTFRELLTSRLAICDLSYLSPNVFYELGVVNACNLPVVLLAEDSSSLPFYVRGERVIEVADNSDFDLAQEKLAAALATVLATTYAPTSIVGQALGLAGPFPPSLREAIQRAAVPLYREGMEYDLVLADPDGDRIRMRLRVSYTLVNRTGQPHKQSVGVVPMRPFEPVYAAIAGEELDKEHPDYLTERGWQVIFDFQPETTTNVTFVVDVDYRMPDADIFATYLPATDFKLTVRYPAERVRVVAESLLRTPVAPDRVAPGVQTYRPLGAVLAYEGFRLDWLAPRKTG